MNPLLKALVWADRAINVLIGGSFNETLSSRAHRMDVKDQPYWGWTASAINRLFFWQVDHCKAQWEYEQAHPLTGEMFPVDKLLHFVAGVAVALFFGLVLSPWAALPAAVLVGGFKELFDSFYPDTHTVDPLDFLATGFGGVLGAGVLWGLQ